MKNNIKGGISDNMTIEDIARKHHQFVGTMKNALEKGIKVEKEHTNNPKIAQEIAMDHLFEDPNYYDKLEKIETKEQTTAGSSGSFESSLSTPITKRDIHNFSLGFKKDVNEMEGISGMVYDAPIGTKKKDPLLIDKKTKSASITAASTKGMIAMKKGFPKFGGPEGKFVEINSKCKKYPYCNQGVGLDNLKLTEGCQQIKTVIKEISKKYGLTTKMVEDIIINESKRISKIN